MAALVRSRTARWVNWLAPAWAEVARTARAYRCAYRRAQAAAQLYGELSHAGNAELMRHGLTRDDVNRLVLAELTGER